MRIRGMWSGRADSIRQPIGRRWGWRPAVAQSCPESQRGENPTRRDTAGLARSHKHHARASASAPTSPVGGHG
jgi:hypothetical protein